jgi:hypothetical protein
MAANWPALEVLSALAGAHPRWPLAHCEHALALSSTDRHAEAIVAPPRDPVAPADGRSLARSPMNLITGDSAGADAACPEHPGLHAGPGTAHAAAALCENRIPEAETQLRQIPQRPKEVAAMRMLAEIAARLRRYRDAETSVWCLELAPGFPARATTMPGAASTAQIGRRPERDRGAAGAEPRNPGT